MIFGEMDDKTKSDMPTVTIIEQPGVSGDGKKSRVNRKYVIIAVASVLVVAMVITAILVGVKFQLDSTTAIVKHSYEFQKDNGDKVKEDVTSDVKDNYVQYHVRDDDAEVWVINDFNRDLQTMKVKRAGGSLCYISVLNRTDSALPEALLNASDPKDNVETENHFYEIGKNPIKDKSMLGTAGQELCDNLDAHWMTPTCDDESNDPSADGGRQKRATLCRRRYCVCYLKRYCSIFSCYWRYYCSCYYRYYFC